MYIYLNVSKKRKENLKFDEKFEIVKKILIDSYDVRIFHENASSMYRHVAEAGPLFERIVGLLITEIPSLIRLSRCHSTGSFRIPPSSWNIGNFQ